MTARAFVLIEAEAGTKQDVAAKARGLPNVEAVDILLGPYDIVVELEADSLTDVPPILSDRIRIIEGIQSTTSLVAFPD